jgi:hypothetical protein
MLFLFFMSTFFTSIFSQKFCVNCRFYVKSPICSNAFAKCSAFPEKSDNQLNYLISGKRKIDYKHYLLIIYFFCLPMLWCLLRQGHLQGQAYVH